MRSSSVNFCILFEMICPMIAFEIRYSVDPYGLQDPCVRAHCALVRSNTPPPRLTLLHLLYWSYDFLVTALPVLPDNLPFLCLSPFISLSSLVQVCVRTVE